MNYIQSQLQEKIQYIEEFLNEGTTNRLIEAQEAIQGRRAWNYGIPLEDVVWYVKASSRGLREHVS